MNGETIERKKSAKYLGLTFDEVLSWRHHVEKLLSELAKYFYLFYNLRKVIPYRFKLQLFNAYVYSRISYGIHCYGVARDVVLNPVQVICNKLLKLLLLKDRRFPTCKLYKESKLLQLKDLTKYVASKLVHMSVYPEEKTPLQLRNHYILNSCSHKKNVRDKLLIRVPVTRNVIGGSSVRRYGASYWNKIDLNIRKLSNVKLSKKHLKLSMLNMYQVDNQ